LQKVKDIAVRKSIFGEENFSQKNQACTEAFLRDEGAWYTQNEYLL